MRIFLIISMLLFTTPVWAIDHWVCINKIPPPQDQTVEQLAGQEHVGDVVFILPASEQLNEKTIKNKYKCVIVSGLTQKEIDDMIEPDEISDPEDIWGHGMLKTRKFRKRTFNLDGIKNVKQKGRINKTKLNSELSVKPLIVLP